MLPAAAALTRPASVSGPGARVQVSSRVAGSAEEQTERPRLSTPGAVRLLTEQRADTSLAWTRDMMRHVAPLGTRHGWWWRYRGVYLLLIITTKRCQVQRENYLLSDDNKSMQET